MQDLNINRTIEDSLRQEVERLNGLYGIIDGQKVIISELEAENERLREALKAVEAVLPYESQLQEMAHATIDQALAPQIEGK